MSVPDRSRPVNDAQRRLKDCSSTVATAKDAIGRIRAGQRVLIGTGRGQPQALVDALLARADELPDVEIIHLVTLALPGCRHEALARHFRLRPFFIDGGVPPGMRKHLGDSPPLALSDIPDLFRSGHLPIDVAPIQVTEPDDHGLCSLGVSVDATRSAAENATLVIAQMNPNMPWTTGDSLSRIHNLDTLVPFEEPLLEGRIDVGPPPRRTSTVLGDGTLVRFRPMHPTDEGRVHGLFHSLSRQTMYYRFMADVARLPHRMIQNLVYIDYRDEMAIVGTIPEASGDEIIAVGRYYLNPGTNFAEVAFIVRDEWQKRGIGTFLLKYLATIAWGQGIAGFTAEVLAENIAMLTVLRNSGFRVSSRLEGRTHSIEPSFE